MNPTEAMRRLNDRDTPPAVQEDIAEGMRDWIAKGGHLPDCDVRQDLIARRMEMGHHVCAMLMMAVNADLRKVRLAGAAS